MLRKKTIIYDGVEIKASKFKLGDMVSSYFADEGKIVFSRYNSFDGWKYRVKDKDGYTRWINESSLRKTNSVKMKRKPSIRRLRK